MPCCRDRTELTKKVITSLTSKGLHEEALVVSYLVTGAWENLPSGWTAKSAEKFWSSLTGDREHKIKACITKMSGRVDDPGAFCGGLASKVGYR